MNNTYFKIARTACFLCLIASATLTQARATTVTYSFDETGWINTFGTTENFFGSFSGTPGATGVLTAADLSYFSAVITETNATGETKTIGTFGSPTSTTGLMDFLYDPALNSLNLSATGAPGAAICMGSSVTTGACGSLPARAQPKPGTPPLPPIEGLFSSSVNGELSAYSTALPQVSLAITIQPEPAPGVANAPEPASFALCGAALIAVALLRIRRRKRLVVMNCITSCLAAGLLPAPSASATTIIQSSGNSEASEPLGYYAPYAASGQTPIVYAVEWSQDTTYNNVDVSANLFTPGSPGTVDYTLVTAIGAGTTFAADGITRGTVTTPTNPANVNLFQLSSLGPGTYYLVLDSPVADTSWQYNFPIQGSYTTAPGVAFLGDQWSSGSSIDGAYTAGSNFSGTSLPVEFEVTGTAATPEPATFALTGMALVVGLICLRSHLTRSASLRTVTRVMLE